MTHSHKGDDTFQLILQLLYDQWRIIQLGVASLLSSSYAKV
jgi:hypothetical protein